MANPNIDNRYCLNCRYPLRGLEENRCPECGRPFDPNDPESTAASAKRTKQWPSFVNSHLSSSTVLALGAASHFHQILAGHPFWWYSYRNVEIIFITFGISAFAYGITRDRKIFSITAATGFFVLVLLGFAFPLLVGLSPLRRWEDVILPLATLFCLASMTSGSALHFIRDVKDRRRWVEAYFLLALGWGYLAWMLLQIAWKLDSEFIEYWTYWFWTPVRW